MIHVETPVLENAQLNQRTGKHLYFKMECYQPIGSFKARGVGALCTQAKHEGYTQFITSSGGNAGFAAAYSGRKLGVEVTVVVPEKTTDMAKARMQAEGANVIVHGAAWDEANDLAMQMRDKNDAAFFVHPFDHETIWWGHSTLVDELMTQMHGKPDAIVVAVGGGGLLSGVLEGMHRHGWDDVPVLAVETDGADSFAQSAAAGQLITLPAITSIATTLGARTVTPRLIDWTQWHDIRPIVVSDTDAVEASLQFADDMRVVTEPACGAALSLCYANAGYLDEFEHVIMVVCGGAGITYDGLVALR
jgi:L-serine/L-threonine ammonia-lyase